MSRPAFGTVEYAYIKKYLGSSITAQQIEWMAGKIEESVVLADIIGLRSDLLGPTLLPDLLSIPDNEILRRLADLYPLRPYERESLCPDDARRLGETRNAMEKFCLPASAMLTDAWIHFSLAEIGFFSAFFRHAPALSICTSLLSRPVLNRLATIMQKRLRFFQCPANPLHEAQWAGDHEFLWDRWVALNASLKPSYEGEPLLISAGIWTKVLATQWAKLGGIAIDMGSVMDCFDLAPTRPAVLATRYNDPRTVPMELSLEAQMDRKERIEDFLF